jgi:hypothetical protein
VFVKREGDPDVAALSVATRASVAKLKKLAAAKLELEAPLDTVTLTQEGEDAPLDCTLTVQEALGGVARPRLIVNAPRVERVPSA